MKQIKTSLYLFTIFISFSFISTTVFAQGISEIFIGTNGKLCNLEHAIYIQKIKTKSAKTATVQTLKLKDEQWEKIYSENYKKVNDSTYQIKANSEEFTGTIYRTFRQQADKTFRFTDNVKGGKIREGFAQSLMPLLLHGKVTEYYKSGNKKSVSEYNNNELVSNENWNEDSTKYIANIFYSTDVEPAFVPGTKVMNQHLIKGFKDAGIDISAISGSMVIAFVIMEDGKLDGLKIIKGLGSSINTAAYESFLSLKGEWKPAKLNNQNVRYYLAFPINFIYKQQSFEFAEMRKGILHWGAY
ncbi:MAG: energy transducer TonB [Bacteroidota bacterium]|nr:energy transducer TonB [Bacteroidota bacterium]